MATKTAAIIQSGTSNYLTPAEAFNVVATDVLTPGIVGSYTATSGVAPTTGSFAVNAQGSPNMTVAVSAGQAYVSATPTSGTAQNIRVKLAASENVTIAANSTGGTRYDFVYIKVDADKLNNPAADGTDVVSLTTQRSTTATVDSNGALANALCIAIVTVTNGAVSIANADISDYRIACNSEFDGWRSANETWAYASATTITVPSGATGKYSVGDKVRIYQANTVKYFYIVAVASTLLTITGGSDYTLTNSTINNPCTSRRATPVGFPSKFAYTPSWTNLTVGTGGNAANVGSFSMDGNTISYSLYMIFGTTGPVMGTLPRFTTPTSVNASYYQSSIGMAATVGEATLLDAATAEYRGHARVCSSAPTTSFEIISINAAGTYAITGSTESTVPFTWADGDGIFVTGQYQL